MMDWLREEERYLEKLRFTAREMYFEYKRLHLVSRKQQTSIRLPAILLSSIGGVASFGTNTFPKHFQKWISVIVGGTSILIALLNTIEAFLKLAETSSGSLAASRSLEKLCDDIDCEMSLPVSDRQTHGVVFVRDCYTRFQQILDSAPVIDKPRVLEQEFRSNPHHTKIAVGGTNAAGEESVIPRSMRQRSIFVPSRMRSIYNMSSDAMRHTFARWVPPRSSRRDTENVDDLGPPLSPPFPTPTSHPSSSGQATTTDTNSSSHFMPQSPWSMGRPRPKKASSLQALVTPPPSYGYLSAARNPHHLAPTPPILEGVEAAPVHANKKLASPIPELVDPELDPSPRSPTVNPLEVTARLVSSEQAHPIELSDKN